MLIHKPNMHFFSPMEKSKASEKPEAFAPAAGSCICGTTL